MRRDNASIRDTERSPLQFWFDFASTYSYPASARIEALAARAGATVEWRPFLLGPIFQAQGWNDSPFNVYPTKGRYMWRDLERICARLELPLRRPTQFPRSGLLAARVVCSARGASWVPDFVRAVYRANFADDRDITSPEVVTSILASLGQDGAATIAAAQTPEVKARLRQETEEAGRVGIFGAPTVVVDGELFWGNDRLEDAVAWHARHAPAR